MATQAPVQNLEETTPEAAQAAIDAKAQKAAAAAEAKAKKDAEKAAAKKAADDAKAEKAKAAAEAKAKKEADAKAKADAKADAKAAKEAEKAKAKEPRPVQNGVRLPKENTNCGKVWALCGFLSNKKGAAITCKELVDAPETVAAELHPNTVTSEYYMWKKYYGLTVPKAEKAPATPAQEAPAAATEE